MNVLIEQQTRLQEKVEQVREDIKILNDKTMFISTELPFATKVIDEVLDAASMLAVCQEEYTDEYTEELEKYSFIFEYLNKILEKFEEYGVEITLPQVLADKMYKIHKY
jgi:hypothetical protein